MKRSGPLKRKTPLRQKSKLQRLTRIRPISAKQRLRKEQARVQANQQALRFKIATFGCKCVVCGKTEAEAIEETGRGHQAHHVISKERLKKIGRIELLWCPENAVAICEEPCHRRVTLRKVKITRAMLDRKWGMLAKWAAEHGISEVLEREVPE